MKEVQPQIHVIIWKKKINHNEQHPIAIPDIIFLPSNYQFDNRKKSELLFLNQNKQQCECWHDGNNNISSQQQYSCSFKPS